MAAFAPMPSASDRTATAVTKGDFNSVRKASLRLRMMGVGGCDRLGYAECRERLRAPARTTGEGGAKFRVRRPAVRDLRPAACFLSREARDTASLVHNLHGCRASGDVLSHRAVTREESCELTIRVAAPSRCCSPCARWRAPASRRNAA